MALSKRALTPKAILGEAIPQEKPTQDPMKPSWDLVSSIRLHPELPRGLQITKQREGFFLVGRKTIKYVRCLYFQQLKYVYTHTHLPHATKNMKFL